jgi:two-component system, chemotaxis family, chemotaxis protein CheY
MKMLTVDDSAVIRKIVKAAAEVLQCELEEAEDGIKALEVLDKLEGKVDLILLDWNMPGMDGYELLQNLKKDDVYKKIPVMMVTTESHKSNIINAIKAGAAHYMIKPFTIEELIKRIMECLGKGVV